MLENKVNFESQTVREDLEKIFGLLNTSATYSPDQNSCGNDDSCNDQVQSLQTRIDKDMLVFKHGAVREKSLLRSRAQQLEEKVARVKREMDTDMDTVKGTVNQLVDDVGLTCKSVNHKLQVLTESFTGTFQSFENTISEMVKENTILKRKLIELQVAVRTDVETLIKAYEISPHHILNIDHEIQAKRIENQARNKQLNIIKELVRLLFSPETKPFSGVYEFENSIYILGSEEKAQNDAMVSCASVGAHLPYVETKEENEFLARLSQTKSRGKYGLWLGGSDSATEGIWLWEPINTTIGSGTYDEWYPGQPDNYRSKEHCLHIWPDKSRWNDIRCDISMTFVCEIEI